MKTWNMKLAKGFHPNDPNAKYILCCRYNKKHFL